MGQLRRNVWILGVVVGLGLRFTEPAAAFTANEVNDIFKVFDTNGDSKVTRTEFDISKVRIIYRDAKTDPIAGITFEQTQISRRFFDSIDANHDGRLSPVETLDGLRFENVTAAGAESFTFEELQRFMNSIGR